MKIMASLFYAYLSFWGISEKSPLPDTCISLNFESRTIDNAIFMTGYHDEKIDDRKELMEKKYTILDCKNKLNQTKKYLKRKVGAKKYANHIYQEAFDRAGKLYNDAYLNTMNCPELIHYLSENSHPTTDLSPQEFALAHDIKREANELGCFNQHGQNQK